MEREESSRNGVKSLEMNVNERGKVSGGAVEPRALIKDLITFLILSQKEEVIKHGRMLQEPPP